MGLFEESIEDLWVAMSLIYCTVSGEEIIVFTSLWIKDFDTLGSFKDNLDWVITKWLNR